MAAFRRVGLSRRWALLVLPSPAGMVNLIAGQNGYLFAALLLAAVALGQTRRPAAAGINWAILAAKPHLGLCVLPMLIAQRRFAVVAWGATFLLSAIAGTLLVYGTGPWLRFFTYTAEQQRNVVEEWAGLLLLIMPTFFIQGRLLGFDVSLADGFHGLLAMLSIVLLVRALPGRDAEVRNWLTWLLLGTFLILPYSFLYDMVAFQAVLALWHREPGALFGMRERRLALALWGVAWVLPYLSILGARLLQLQITPLFLLFLLWRRSLSSRTAVPGVSPARQPD